MAHAQSHVSHAARHIESAVGHLKNAGGAYLKAAFDPPIPLPTFRKMAGASMVKAAFEMGRSKEQVVMANKHAGSVIGRPGWDGTAEVGDANTAINDAAHHLDLAHDRHAEMAEAVHDQDAERIKDAHSAVMAHLGHAASATSTAARVIDAALKAHADEGGPEKQPGATNKEDAFTSGPNGNQLVGYNLDGTPKKKPAGKVSEPEILKGHLDRSGDDVRLFVPFTKVTALKTAQGETLVVSGIASVADYLDDQNDIPDAAALEAAMRQWAPFGNIREQHKADKPVGTIREPIIGEWTDGNPRPGWRMITHPITGTPAAEITAHIVDSSTVKLIKAGVMTGFSIGGKVTESRDVYADVDDSGVVRAILGDA